MKEGQGGTSRSRWRGLEGQRWYRSRGRGVEEAGRERGGRGREREGGREEERGGRYKKQVQTERGRGRMGGGAKTVRMERGRRVQEAGTDGEG